MPQTLPAVEPLTHFGIEKAVRRCRDRRKKIEGVRLCRTGNRRTIGEGQAMPMQQYVVRKQDGLWEVWLGGRLLSGQPTYVEALKLADSLAYAAVQRGEPSG